MRRSTTLRASSAPWALIGLCAAEIVGFSLAAPSFSSAANAVEVARVCVELGLVSTALTLVVIGGGIDLSVGSMMGLCAVCFGKLWRDGGLSIVAAGGLAVLAGAAGGALNAMAVVRLRAPPLVATLASYALFRGIAEGLTGGADNFTGLPASFLWLGQGTLVGVPPGSLLLAGCAGAVAVLLAKTTFGRSLSVVGFSPEGARHAALPAGRVLAVVYTLSGVAAALAGLITVARLGQAKADAGTGYELFAVTAVVLGGTPLSGGRGSLGGTLLGLAALAILQNGLRLSGLPAALGGILTGTVLVSAIAIGHAHTRAAHPTAPQLASSSRRSRGPRRLRLAVLVLAVAAVASGAWLRGRAARAVGSGARRLVVAMMPKALGDPYFVSARRGAEEAARELQVELLWDGPSDLDPARQNEVVETWITRRVDVIAVSVDNAAALSTALRKARAAGIKVLTWDADAQSDARDFFVNQATPQGIGVALADHAARLLQGSGKLAVVTASLTATNQNEWLRAIRARLAARHPGVQIVDVRPSDGERDRAFIETQTLLKLRPDVRLIVAIAAPAVPGAAEAVRQSGRDDVKVIGLSLPSMARPYIEAGVVDCIVLWNTTDLGYVTVQAAEAVADGRLKPGSPMLRAGRLGAIEVRRDEVLLGEPTTFDRTNIKQFDF